MLTEITERRIKGFRFAAEGHRRGILVLRRPDRNAADQVALWTEATGMASRFDSPSWILDAIFLGDSRFALSCDGSLHIYDAQRGSLLKRTDFGRAAAYELASDPAGRWVAGSFVGGDPALCVLDTISGAMRIHTPVDGKSPPMFPNVSMSRDGQWAALSHGYRSIGIWHLETGEARSAPDPESVIPAAHPSVHEPERLRALLPLIGQFTRRIWLSPDGSRLVAAGMIPYRRYASDMCLWLVEWGRETRSWFVALDSTFAGIDLTPDHALCAAPDGESRDVVALWDVATGQRVHRMSVNVGDVVEIRFSPDAMRIAIAGESRLDVRKFSARRWNRGPASQDGFWWLMLDESASATPVGRRRFISAFRDASGGASISSWEEAVRVAERATASSPD